MTTPPPPPQQQKLTDEELTQQLQLLKSQLNKKQTFETSLNSIKSLLLSTYPSSSLPIRTLFYDVVCRVATVLRTRYTFPHYLSSGLELLQAFNRLAVNSVEISRVQSLISEVKETLIHQQERDGGGGGRGGYLFEGHLTVDPEPPQPNWLVQQNLLTALAATRGDGESSDGSNAVGALYEDDNATGVLMRRLLESLDLSVMENLDEILPAGLDGEGRRSAPPASKEVVEKLLVIKVEDEEALRKKFGEDGGECCICKEKLVLGDEMQEMPCKHLFHPLCLKPWLDEHNSCPICRHELPTDDHKYESWKEREKELEEERRGAANAVREGEYMYV